jgi:hypothetical protein
MESSKGPGALLPEVLPLFDAGEQWDLCLYVTGSSPRGRRAIEHLRRAREEHLKGR